MKRSLAKLGGALVLVAVGTRIAEMAGVRRLQCAYEPDCWCKRPELSLFRWLVPGRFHQLKEPQAEAVD